MNEKINQQKNKTYQIGKTTQDRQNGLIKAKSAYTKRFIGKQDSFTNKLEKSTNLNPSMANERTEENFVLGKSPTMKIIKKIWENSEKDKKFDDLYNLIHQQDLLTIAHGAIQTNKGATTPGPQKRTIDNMSLKRIHRLMEKLKNQTFEWSGNRIIKIPRPGKDPRPLGLPDYDDKIVQSAIKIILDAIYDKEFKNRQTNFGFISHKSCHDNIKNIKEYKNIGLNTAIEGDIKGAFDNVNHEILIKILSKKIKDKEFLKIIYKACKASKTEIINNETIFTPITNLGTPQGSIISPILFNIYMNEFDKYILKEINEFIQNKNQIEKRIPQPIHPKYLKYKSIIDACKKGIKKIQEKNIHFILNKQEKEKLQKYKDRILKMKQKRFKIPYINQKKCTIRYTYNRYADDFIILTNADDNTAKEIKEKIKTYLKEELKLTLSEEKTKITNLEKSEATYLGFTLYTKSIKVKNENLTLNRTPKLIKIGIDMKRRIQRLKEKKFMSENGKPRETPYLMSFEPQQIIDLYNSIIDGTVIYYYGMLNNKSRLNYIIYILQYSCLKTIASKLKTTIRKLYTKHGWPEYNMKGQKTGRIRLVWEYEIQRKENPEYKYTILRNYTDAMDMGKWTSINMKLTKSTFNDEELVNHDFRNYFKLNWRTKFKYDSCCTICGSTENIESHHVRKISGPKAKKELTIMQKLNRKQIILCRDCHKNIHQGKHNGKSLKDIAEIRNFRIGNYHLMKPNLFELKMMQRKGTITTNKIHSNEEINIETNTPQKVESKPILLYPIDRYIINKKEKAQRVQKTQLQKATLRKINIL